MPPRLSRGAGGRSCLTGVNISAWRSSGIGFRVLREILAATTRARIRLSSLEPESLSPDLVEAISEARICPHFHIPVQSGSDNVLAMMRRRYRSAGVIDGVGRLRAARRDPFIAADILVGFPGETREDFEQTRGMVERLQFAALHVFPFSSRPGTAAASMTPVVPERIRRERARELSGAFAGVRHILHAGDSWPGSRSPASRARKSRGPTVSAPTT